MKSRFWPAWTLVAVAILAIGLVTVQSFSERNRSPESDRGEIISVSDGDLAAVVTLNDGAHKPTLIFKGTAFLEFSDWASEIITRDDSRSLWDSRFRVDSFGDTAEIVHTRSVDEYEISQITDVESDHATVSYFIAPKGRDDIGPVTLTLSHYHWYFSAVEIVPGGAVLSYPETPDVVWFRHGPNAVLEIRSDDVGTNSFTSRYSLDRVPPGERTLLASEEVWFVPPPE